MTRWSSHALRKTRRRSQCTSERSAGPTSSCQRAFAVHGEVHEIVEFVLAQPRLDEAELDRRLLDSLAEVLLVEHEPELSVLQDVVVTGLVVAPSLCVVLCHIVRTRRSLAR